MSASLRRRVLLGAILWSAGLFVIAGGAMMVVINHHEHYAQLVHHFFSHAPLVTLVAVFCLALGLLYVRRGLSPVGQLRERLGQVHGGRATRVTGHYPAEIQPLVDDMNALLENQERTVQRAVAKAGDLAHGLKTPLALLANEAERAAAAGHTDVAAAISQQVERMRRQIDHHLAHARAAASGPTPGLRTQVATSAEGLVRTLQQLYAARTMHIDIDTAAEHAVRVTREDLDEMLGNLLDNACKWGRTHARISSSISGDMVLIVVEDDGAGLPAELREKVLQRGVRVDEAAPGSGIGLAIVRDLAEVYGGRIALDASPFGGLRASLRLPRAE